MCKRRDAGVDQALPLPASGPARAARGAGARPCPRRELFLRRVHGMVSGDVTETRDGPAAATG